MFQKVIYKILKSPVMIAALSCGLIAVFYYSFQFDSNRQNSIENVREQIEKNNGHMAIALFYKKNKTAIENVMDNLLISFLDSYRVESSDGSIIVESDHKMVCREPLSKNLVADLLNVGTIYYCLSEAKIAKATVATYPMLFLILFVIVVAVLTPVFASDKYLGILLESADNPDEPIQSFSKRLRGLPKATAKAMLKIRQKNDEVLDAAKLTSQLENENQHIKVVRHAAHDLLAPITSIQKKRRLQAEISEKELDVFIGKISKVCEELRKGTRSDSYKLNEVEEVSVHKIASDILGEKKVLCPDVKFKLDCDENIEVLAVKMDFYRVLSNLITNSCEALNDTRNGEVQVAAKKVINKVEIEVSDNGLGISESEMGKIFNEGYTSGKALGSGLGLYYVNKKINEWGGRVEGFSGNGRTVFTLTLNTPYEESGSDEVVI